MLKKDSLVSEESFRWPTYGSNFYCQEHDRNVLRKCFLWNRLEETLRILDKGYCFHFLFFYLPEHRLCPHFDQLKRQSLWNMSHEMCPCLLAMALRKIVWVKPIFFLLKTHPNVFFLIELIYCIYWVHSWLVCLIYIDSLVWFSLF